MVDREFGRPPTQGGLPNDGSEYILEVRNSGVRYFCMDVMGYFDKPLPPRLQHYQDYTMHDNWEVRATTLESHRDNHRDSRKDS